MMHSCPESESELDGQPSAKPELNGSPPQEDSEGGSPPTSTRTLQLQSPPTQGSELYRLLDLDPSADRDKYDNNAVRLAIQRNPEAAKKAHEFKLWGGVHSIHPIFMATALGGSRDVIELIYNAHPTAITEKTSSGLTLFTCACYYGASAETVQLLIGLHPQFLEEKDKDGYYPLHYAVFVGCSLKVLRLMVEKYPQAMSEVDKNGNTPLMIAKEIKASPKILALLSNEPTAVAADPAVHKVLDLNPTYDRDKFDNNALHDAILRNPNSAKAKYNFKAWTSDDTVYPLFMAIALWASYDTIALMYKAFPLAIMEKTNSARTPLHYASFYGGPADVVIFLVKNYPQALSEKDKLGRLPLHYACYFEAPLHVLKVMVKLYPQARNEKDNDGNYPLAIAKNFTTSPDMLALLTDDLASATRDPVIHNLLNLNPSYQRGKFDNGAVRNAIESNPSAARSKYDFKALRDVDGVRPLFLACALSATRDVIELFYDACPEAIMEQTCTGRTPLHYACYHGARADVVRFLVEKNPGATELKDRNDCTPLVIAQDYNALPEVVELLRNEHPDIALDPVVGDLLNLDPSSDRDKLDLDAVRNAIEDNPHAARVKYNFKGLGDVETVHPLMMVVALGASLDLVELVYNAFPLAIMEKTSTSRTPLHTACVHGSPAGVVKLLVERYPKAKGEKDDDGNIPEMLAKEVGASGEVLELVEFEDSAEHPSPILLTLLDLNITYEREKFDGESVCKLIELFPNAATVTYDFKVWGGVCSMYPLFKVAALDAARSVVEVVYDANPMAIRERTDCGWTPLHYALHFGVSVDVVEFLVETYPEALTQEDVNGNTPLMIAGMCRASPTVLALLTKEREGGSHDASDEIGDVI